MWSEVALCEGGSRGVSEVDWEEDQNLLKAHHHHFLLKAVVVVSEVVVGLATVAGSEGAGAGSEVVEDSATVADSEEEAVAIVADVMTDTGKFDELNVVFRLVTLRTGVDAAVGSATTQALETGLRMGMALREVVQVGMADRPVTDTVLPAVVGITVATSSAKVLVGMMTETPSDRGTSCGLVRCFFFFFSVLFCFFLQSVSIFKFYFCDQV